MEKSQPDVVTSMFWSIASGTDDAFVVVDQNQRIIVFNGAAEALFGYSFDAVHNLPLTVLMPEWAIFPSRHDSLKAKRCDGTEFQVSVTILKTSTADETLYGAIVRDVTGFERAEALLQATLTETADVTGTEFFDRAVRVLAETLKIHTAFIALPIANKLSWNRMIATWTGGRTGPIYDYQVEGTPCALAIDEEVVFFSEGIQDVFPKVKWLKDLQAAGYMSLQLNGRNGQRLGHVGLINTEVCHLTDREFSSLRVFGSRIAAELDRIRIDSEAASESDFRTRISESAPFGVTHRDLITGQIWSNDAFQRIMGRTYAQCRELGWDKIIHPDDLHKFTVESDKLRTTNEAVETSLRILHPSGETRWILRHGGTKFDSVGRPIQINTTVVDLTATERALDELRATSNELDLRNAELEGSLNAFPDIHFRLTADGTYLSVGAADPADLAAPADQLIGTNIAEYMSADYAQAALEAISQTLDTGEVSSVQYSWELPSGTRHFEARFAPLADNQVMAVVRDVGDLRALEAQVVHASTMESVGLLAGGLAHDFNNVLHIIGGHAAALQRDTSDPEITEKRVGAITRAVERTSSLIERLMTISRPAPNNPSPTSIDDLLESLGPSLTQILGDSVTLEFDLNATGASVLIDDTRLESALLNLASNARDAMPTGGTLSVATSLAQKNTVQIRVADTGIGIENETAGHIFTPFFTTKSVGVGTGLGLATTYSTVVGAHGSIAVDSSPGEGTVFTIKLPTSHLLSQTKVDPSAEPPHLNGAGTTLLVVEDEEDVLELCSDSLEQMGYRVRQASNGADALALIEQGIHIDGVLTDIAMPGLSGPELAKELANHMPEVPVIYMSGYSPEKVGASIPLSHLLRKPFTNASLQKILSEHIT